MWLLISPEGKFFISRGLPVFNAKPWKFFFVQCFSLYVIKMESHLGALIWKGKSSCLFFQEFPNVLKVTQLWLKLPFIQQLVVTYCVECERKRVCEAWVVQWSVCWTLGPTARVQVLAGAWCCVLKQDASLTLLRLLG